MAITKILPSDYFGEKYGISSSIAVASLASSTVLFASGNASISADVSPMCLVNGDEYTIKVVGDTDWVSLGATGGGIGEVFTATGAATEPSTGVATTGFLPAVTIPSIPTLDPENVIVGRSYVIHTLGDTDWEAMGSPAGFSVEGTVFEATAAADAGTTGLAQELDAFTVSSKSSEAGVITMHVDDFVATSALDPEETSEITNIDPENLVVGSSYTITVLGNTNWQDIGAPTGAVVGTSFTASEQAPAGTTGKATFGDARRVLLGILENAYQNYLVYANNGEAPIKMVFSRASAINETDDTMQRSYTVQFNLSLSSVEVNEED